MKRLGLTCGAFVARDFLSEFSYRLSFAMVFLGIFVQVATWYLVSHFVEAVGDGVTLRSFTGNLDYFAYVLVGMMLQRFMNIAMYNYAGTIRGEQVTGTLESILITPTPLPHVLIGASCWSYVMAGIQMATMLLFGVWVFGVELQAGGWLVAMSTILMSIFALSGIGILSAAFVIYFKRGNPVNFVISTASLLFGNVIIPVQSLPDSLGWISTFVPIAYATEAVRRAIYHGAGFAEVQHELLVLAGFGLVMIPVGLVAARLAIRHAKREGTLVQY